MIERLITSQELTQMSLSELEDLSVDQLKEGLRKLEEMIVKLKLAHCSCFQHLTTERVIKSIICTRTK